MRSAQLAEDTQAFVVCTEENQGSSKADRNARRRLESERRKLIRSVVRVCHRLTDDEICSVAEYMLLVAT
jgi:hypothetical protein